ncbi:PQQ-binding-like beta-propeller repeat protein [Thalassoglobus sp. JC818]|uniref:PQQ-binding-like beta-propeller repeat protein n=1 Tax=Thalassoglobus sp. JC818 TaxID=3232136 RepID=UPI00345A2A1B
MTNDFRQINTRMLGDLHQVIVLTSLLSLLIGNRSAASDDWSSFQDGGRVQRTGESGHNDEGEYELEWTTDVEGYGQSSPVAWNGALYVTSVSGENKETLRVSAFTLETGKQRWKHEFPNATPQESSNYVSKAAPTPVVDEAGVIAFFEGGNVIALSHEGEVRWQRDLVADYGAIDARHGIGSSLEQSKDSVFVWVERSTEPYILAVDKSTGENIWKVEGLGVTSWSSPRLVDVESAQHLVFSGSGMLVGIDPGTGDRLWQFDEISGNTTPTPIPVGNGQFLIGATDGRGESESGRAAQSNGIVQIARNSNGDWQANYLWQSKRATSSFGSPIMAEGRCFFINRTGVMYCVDASSGEEMYAERVGGSVWATPIAMNQRIFLPLKDGKLVIGGIGDSNEMITELEIPTASESGDTENGLTIYAAILAGDRVILRTGEKLFSVKAG